MAFIVKKIIHGKEYFYLNENKRVGGKVKTKTLAYLGKTREGAEKRKIQFLSSLDKPKEEKISIEETKNKSEIEKKEVESKKISISDLAVFCKRKVQHNRSCGIYYRRGRIFIKIL